MPMKGVRPEWVVGMGVGSVVVFVALRLQMHSSGLAGPRAIPLKELAGFAQPFHMGVMAVLAASLRVV
jgi:hypothetical protein